MEKDPGVRVGERLNVRQRGALAARKGNGTVSWAPPAEGWQWDGEGIVPLYSALVRLHLRYCMQVWGSQYKKDVKLLERVQRRCSEGWSHLHLGH